MTWLRRLGWGVLAIATLATAVLPDLLTLPEPDYTHLLDRATYSAGNSNSRQVSLPNAEFPKFRQSADIAHYRIGFDLSALPDQNLFVFIPTINRRISLLLNGDSFLGFESSALMTGPLISTPVMAQLPRSAMIAGHNRLTVAVEAGRFATPTYLSKIYLGTEAGLVSSFKWRTFLDTQLKTMAVAGHVLLGFGLIIAYFVRPKDPLFFWLAALNFASLFVAAGLYVGYQPELRSVLPIVVALLPTVGILFVGFTLALMDFRPPKALSYAAVAVLCVLVPFSLFDTMLSRTVMAAIAIASLTVAYITAAILLAWGAFRRGSTDARLILGPVFLLAWFAVRDVYVTATAPEHGFNLLVTYPRPILLAFVTAILMRRMGLSLDQFDRANETLNSKLAEREAELAVLYLKERAETTRLTREHERQRLTHDLHDGLSGHLVSIIALSERSGEKPTEQAAREALNDLRLVIYSLDLDDRELPLALANFRERLIPQLHRLGIELDWSIAGLPEVSGVTPSNALAILRILQEAITNAVKHGPARKITIRGTETTDGMAAIALENDGGTFVDTGGGHGLINMRRRAERLHGSLNIESVDHGVKLTLLLPSHLPDLEEA